MKAHETKVYLVIPTIRDLDFLKSWKDAFKNCHLLVVEDRENKTVKIPNKNFLTISHYSRADIDKDLGKNNWIISRKNAGIRAFGFLKAFEKGADVIITIDDDCYPVDLDFVNLHLDNLNFKAPINWVNTYPDPKWMFSRGIPYSVREKTLVGISHGLWSGALDLDAKTEIKLDKLLNEKPYPPIRQIIPFGSYYPMCSMNLAFRREMVPLLYFPMMGLDTEGSQWDYDRYDDVWAGIFSKKIMDHLGYGVISGSPFIDHRKESMPKVNYRKEVQGMQLNEILWKRVNAVKLSSKSPKECYLELAKKVDFPRNNYFKKLKKAMVIWAKLF